MLFFRITAGLKNLFKKTKLSESEVTSPKPDAASVELGVKFVKPPAADADSKPTTPVEEPKDGKGSCLSNDSSR